MEFLRDFSSRTTASFVIRRKIIHHLLFDIILRQACEDVYMFQNVHSTIIFRLMFYSILDP